MSLNLILSGFYTFHCLLLFSPLRTCQLPTPSFPSSMVQSLDFIRKNTVKLPTQPGPFDIKVAAVGSGGFLCCSWLLWFISCLSHDLKHALPAGPQEAGQHNGGIFPPRYGAVSLSAKFKLTTSGNKRFLATNRPLRTKHVVSGLSYSTAKPSSSWGNPRTLILKWEEVVGTSLTSSCVVGCLLTVIVQWYFPERVLWVIATTDLISGSL